MYRRLCTTLNTKGELIPSTEDIYSHIKDLNVDHYLSVYSYSERQKETFYSKIEKLVDGEMVDTINGAAGINDVFTNQFILDFDIDKLKGNTLEDVKADTIEAVRRLIDSGISQDAIQLTFSGNKGFGITVDINQNLTPDAHKKIAKNLMGDLQSWDSKVYNASRILRIPYTKHQDSGLFKMPMLIMELDEPIETIQEWAKDVDASDSLVYTRVALPMSILKLSEVKPERKRLEGLSLEAGICTLDFTKKPKWLSDWKYALSEGYFPPSSRSYALLILGATYANQGFNKLTTYRMLKGAAELQSMKFDSDRFPDEEIWKNIIEQIYSPTWNGGTYSEDHFPDEIADYLEGLKISRTKVDDEAFVTVNDVFAVFEDFAENIEKNTVKTGITELDGKCRMTTSMLVGLLGAPGAGKTASVLNILNQHSLDGESSIFFSFDMGKPLVYQKLAQKFTGFQSDDLFEIFKNRDETQKEFIRTEIAKNFANTQMCFKTGSTVDDMKRYIEDFQAATGKKVRMIAVDYLEKLVGPFSDATANSGFNAAKLQELANDLEICVLLLLQPQKMAGDPSEPLLTYRRVKGASVIEQDCRVILSVYREGYDPQSFDDDDFITFSILKNTMGELGSVDCYWTGLTGQIDELDDTGREELKALRRRRSDKKAMEIGSL